MRDLPAAMTARLQSGVTTFCHVWKLIRADGALRGFTDHDRDLTLDGLVCAARSALDPGEMESALGLGVAGGEVAGALSADTLAEADLADGRYDGASVETWLVDWSDVSIRALLDVATIGEVKRIDHAFTAELRSLAHALDQEQGRIYQAPCAADFGDARCGLDATAPSWSTTAVVEAPEETHRVVAQLGSVPAGFFTDGALTFLSGPLAGATRRVRAHALEGGRASLTLWTPVSTPAQAGTQFRVVAGCDKRWETCRDRFANTAAFRGFPHMPGNDYVLRYATQGDAGLDGGLAR